MIMCCVQKGWLTRGDPGLTKSHEHISLPRSSTTTRAHKNAEVFRQQKTVSQLALWGMTWAEMKLAVPIWVGCFHRDPSYPTTKRDTQLVLPASGNCYIHRCT